MDILGKLGFKQRKHVGISISANNFIELVCIDKMSKAVVKYSSDNIKYNSSIREVVDYEELAEALERLFEDAGINPKDCSVTLSLPNVHFGITPIEGDSEEGFIIENISTDLEDLYIFKRNEPTISYSKLENGAVKGQKNIVYSALQSKVKIKMLEIFDNLGAELVRIDTSYSSLFKAFQFCDRFNKYLLPDEKTLIVLTTSNSCSAFLLNGSVVADVAEEPIAIKSFTQEEVYGIVSKLATNSILKTSPKTLLVVSETDEIDASVVSQRLDFSGEVDYINKSTNNNDQFIEVYGIGTDIDSDMISYLTIEAVGAAVSDFDDYPLNINFIPKERMQKNIVQVGSYEIQFEKYLVSIVIAAVLIAFVAGLFINFLCGLLINNAQDKNTNIKKDISVFNKTIDENKSASKVDILPVMTKIVNQNKSVIETYNALSTDIPDNVYIKQFVTQSNGGIGILGEAKNSESVQIFVDQLKEKNNSLSLTKLSVNSQGDSLNSKIPDGYTFEIKTPMGNINFDMQNQASQINNGNDGYNPDARRLPPPSPII